MTPLLASRGPHAQPILDSAPAKRGIDPSLVEDPIRITPEIKTAADAMVGRSGGTVDQLKRVCKAACSCGLLHLRLRRPTDRNRRVEALASGRGAIVVSQTMNLSHRDGPLPRLARVQAGYIQPRGDRVRSAAISSSPARSAVGLLTVLHDRYIVFDFKQDAGGPDPSRSAFSTTLELAAPQYVNNRAVLPAERGGLRPGGGRPGVHSPVLEARPEFAAAEAKLSASSGKRRRGDIPGAL